MSALVVLAVGKVKEPGIREAIDDYYKRVRRHFSLEEIELRDAEPAPLVTAIDKRLPGGAQVVAMEVEGKSLSSEAFARWLGTRTAQGKGKVAFLIGGAEGLPREVVARAAEKISLSPMTLPHRLARLVLAEQLYRATTILRGEPYAR